MIKWILLAVSAITLIVAAIVTWLWITHPAANIEQKRLYFDAYTSIGIGFLAALLGTLIPNLILESRDKFERSKQSRIAYSHAKTSVIYLPGTLAVLDYGDAMAAIREAHGKLHIAETFGKELTEYLKWYGNGDSQTWIDQTYWELTVVRTLLQRRADQWKNLSLGDRTDMIESALKAIRELFGTNGEKWKKGEQGRTEADARAVVERLCAAQT